MFLKLMTTAYVLLIILFIANCGMLHWGELDKEFYNFLFKANTVVGIAVGYFTYAYLGLLYPKEDDSETDLS